MKWAAMVIAVLGALLIFDFISELPEAPHSFKGHVHYQQYAEQQETLCINKNAYGQSTTPWTLQEFCNSLGSAAGLSKAVKEHPEAFQASSR